MYANIVYVNGEESNFDGVIDIYEDVQFPEFLIVEMDDFSKARISREMVLEIFTMADQDDFDPEDWSDDCYVESED